MWKRLNNLWVGKIRPRVIAFLLFVTGGEVLYISLALVLATIVALTQIRACKFDNVIELTTFSAVVLEGFLLAVTRLMRARLLNFTEDPSKLTTDYQGLALDRYSSERNLVWNRNSHDIQVIPVKHIAWLYNRTLRIEDSPTSSYELPDIIDKHFEELFSTHKTSNIYNNTNIRVDNWYIDDSNVFVMQTGRTSYYNSLVTNRAMDYLLSDGISVRELLECGPFLRPLKYSQLSNHLGFNGFVESADGQIMLVFRKGDLSIGKRTFGDSIGASLKTKYALDDNFSFTIEGLREGIVREIEDELGIPWTNLIESEDVSYQDGLGPIELIAAYRDLLEGGKPQLLFYAKTSLTKEEAQEAFDRKNKINVEKSAQATRSGKERVLETDGSVLHWIPLDELAECEVYPDRLIHNGLQLSMLPSASASIAMFVDYLRNSKAVETFKGNEEIREAAMPVNSYGNRVTESFIRGKRSNQDLCEDAIFLGDRFVVVVDGVTAKGHISYSGKSSGRLAAEVILKVFRQIDRIVEEGESKNKNLINDKDKPVDKPVDVLKSLDEALSQVMEEATKSDGISIGIEDYPRASVIYFDRKYKVIVSYGDCQCRIDDRVFTHAKKIDEILSAKRARILKDCLDSGMTVDELRNSDPGREAIIDDLQRQFSYENTTGEMGYPVLNGHGICEEMIVVHQVQPCEPIVLCSDGYPVVCASLEESERELERVLREDPLLFQEHPSTKGWDLANESYDDRAWVSL